MHLLEPDNPHHVDQMENSLYNMLLAAQVGSQGYHYLNFLQQNKDWRYLDRATCCASLATRLVGLLPQFLYTYTEDSVNCDIYAASEADLPNGVSLKVDTALPDEGQVPHHHPESRCSLYIAAARACLGNGGQNILLQGA